MPKPMTVMAFDYGTRRVGVAVGNSETGLGQALKTIAAPNLDGLFKEIESLLKEWQPERLVVGKPLHPDGAEHEMTAKATRFGNQLQGRFHLPVDWVDERYTSAVLEGDAQMQDNLDAHSAALLLEQYFSELAAQAATKYVG
ncbi:Holliday junction resolvase RuvX [Polynucleobacter sp. 15G-AUS-farblos]|uniref:Holliday junction resolvase RuvX n=1 Tax=Polynucleobacter sp. 15G-AUS-farblos TaxID=2689094 RepID=UPI001C0D0D1B|nr:Holliday junction resolvase RuvX [Polynucleobacter sp. 15G-AUS-farblos]MBU3583800.1 Holliday junction resolvase RuvX [Polynucleobacter sp. 15G-AUS-farblos]